jgi:hypothetical protein
VPDQKGECQFLRRLLGNQALAIQAALKSGLLAHAVDFRLLLLSEQLGRWAALAGQVSPPVSLITSGLPGESIRSRSSNDLSGSYQPKYGGSFRRQLSRQLDSW